jgi:hypothetical protein
MTPRSLTVLLLSVLFWLSSWLIIPIAQALTPIQLLDVSYKDCPPELALSISRIFLNKKRRNLKKGETIDRYSFERRN